MKRTQRAFILVELLVVIGRSRAWSLLYSDGQGTNRPPEGKKYNMIPIGPSGR